MSDDGNPQKVREVLSLIVFKIIADYGYGLIKRGIEKLISKMKKRRTSGKT